MRFKNATATFAYAGLCALAGMAVAAPSAHAATADAAITPAVSCGQLAKTDLTSVDAQVASAQATTRDGHAFCDVRGYDAPTTQFKSCCR